MVQACSVLGARDFGDRGRMRLQPVQKLHYHDKVRFHAEIFLLLYHGRMSLSCAPNYDHYALIINSQELRKVERTEAFGVMMMKNS